MFKSALLALAATAGLSDALGINCRGSGLCSGNKGALGQLIAQVRAIACIPFAFGNLCAFYQGIGSRTFTKEQSVTFLDQLRQHGCSKCGSIPVDPGNDVKNGQLTVNYVA
ncbi:TOX4 [Fusarium coicis]|nr:TOX4 [Fusarium coicis]